MINALRKLGMEGMYLNIIKAIYDKPMANIILNGDKLKPISPKMRNEAREPTFPTPIQYSPGIPSQSNRQKEKIKGIQIGKKNCQNIPICRPQRPKKLYPKTPRHHKQLQQCGRIQNQLTGRGRSGW
jgi:hypothetical protein